MVPRLMTIDEVADCLAIAPSTLRTKKFRNENGLNIIRVGRQIRFIREDIENFISRNMEYANSKSDGN